MGCCCCFGFCWGLGCLTRDTATAPLQCLWKGKGLAVGFWDKDAAPSASEVALGWLEEVVMTEHTPRAGQAPHRDEGWVIKH